MNTVTEIILTARRNFERSKDPRFKEMVHVFGDFAVCSVYATVYDMISGDKWYEIGTNYKGNRWIYPAAAAVNHRDGIDSKIISLLSSIYEHYEISSNGEIPQPNINLMIKNNYILMVGDQNNGFIEVFKQQTMVQGKWREGIVKILQQLVDKAEVFKANQLEEKQNRLTAIANIELK